MEELTTTGGTKTSPARDSGVGRRRMSTSTGLRSFMSSKSFDTPSFAKVLQDRPEDNNDIKLEAIRLKVKKFFATSLFGHIYSNILLILSVLSSIQYLYQTYLHSDNPEDAVI